MLSIVRYHSGEHVGIDREQVDTFREEIARRTDTSRARSSYPQHPAVAATAVAAAVEGDEAEHARNSASPPPLSSLLTPSDGLQPPIRPSASSSPPRFHPPRLSSPRSTSVVAPSTPRSSFRAEFASSSTEFDFTLYCPLVSV